MLVTALGTQPAHDTRRWSGAAVGPMLKGLSFRQPRRLLARWTYGNEEISIERYYFRHASGKMFPARSVPLRSEDARGWTPARRIASLADDMRTVGCSAAWQSSAEVTPRSKQHDEQGEDRKSGIDQGAGMAGPYCLRRHGRERYIDEMFDLMRHARIDPLPDPIAGILRHY